MDTPNLIEKILNWLRAGYPQGIPQQDYVALFGVLHRSLTDTEVDQVATELYRGDGGLDSSIPEEKIHEAIRRLVLQTPSEEDVRRVAARLAEGGWPLEDVKQA